MKTKFLVMALLAIGLVATTSCSDDDNYIPEDIYVQAFLDKYPDAQRIEWENKNGYKVADFRFQNKEAEAWFDKSAQWLLTETDLKVKDLPAAVQSALAASEYASWRVDDVDKVERPDAEVVYVIEVEKNKQEYDLYFSEDGTLIKTVQDEGNAGHLPLVVSQKVIDKIKELYPNATLFLEFEREGEYLEIEIKDGKTYKEVYFDKDEEWVYTQWEIRQSDVPQIVMNALKASSYGNYKIDDVDVIHNPQGIFYLFELESGNKEVYCLISESGELEEV